MVANNMQTPKENLMRININQLQIGIRLIQFLFVDNKLVLFFTFDPFF